MAISKNDVRHIAQLARLHVADAELDAICADLSDILNFVEQLNAVDTRDVAPMAHPLGDLTAVLRDDRPATGIPRARIQADAPDTEDGFYKVPTVIESA